MAYIILHKNGVFNIYSTICDAPIFESGITEDQVNEFILDENGKQGLTQLPKRIEQAKKKGTSGLISSSLEDEICANRAGENEAELNEDEFINKFLTIKD